MQLIHSNFVYSKDKNHFSVHSNSYIGIDEGKVKGIWPVIPEEYQNVQITDYIDSVIIPAFSDLHVHAPQYPNRGLYMDLLLIG